MLTVLWWNGVISDRDFEIGASIVLIVIAAGVIIWTLSEVFGRKK